MAEDKIGEVVKYFAKPGVAAIQLSKGSLRISDTIHIKGHTTDFEQQIQSMQVEHQEVQTAGPGQSIGIKVKERVREGDAVYKVTAD
jgi:translation elongation factor EF-1alpha